METKIRKEKKIIFLILGFLISLILIKIIIIGKELVLIGFVFFILLILLNYKMKNKIINYKNSLILLILTPSLFNFISFFYKKDIAVSFICFLFFVAYFKENKEKHKTETILLFLFLIISFLSIFQTIYINPYINLPREDSFQFIYIRSIIQLLVLFFTLIPFFFIVYNKELSKNYDKYLLIYFYSVLFAGIYGLYGFLNHYIPLPMNKFFSLQTLNYSSTLFIPRLQSFMREPLELGHYLGSILPLSIIFYIYKNQKKYLFFSFLIIVALFLTLSRSTLISIFIAMFILFILLIIKKKYISKEKVFKTIKFYILLFVVLIMCLFVYDRLNNGYLLLTAKKIIDVKNKFFYFKHDYSALIRLNEIKATVGMLKEHPFLGVGIGNIWFHSSKHKKYIYYFTEVFGENSANIPNIFLHIYASTGFIGGIIFTIFIILIILNTIKKIYESKEEKQILFLIGIFASFLHLMIQYQTFYINCIYVWIITGFLVKIYSIKKE